MRIDTSSMLVGSSARSTVGSTASARAIATRWRWPPESSCGYFAAMCSGGTRPTRLQQVVHVRLDLVRRDDPVDAERPLEVMADRLRPGSASRTDPGRSSAPASGSEDRGGAGRARRPGRRSGSCPRSASYRRASRRATVLFPLPLSPTSAVIVPGAQREADVVDGVHVAAPAEQAVAGREALREVAHLERRVASGAHAPASARWQATKCSGSTSRSSGRSVVCRRYAGLARARRAGSADGSGSRPAGRRGRAASRGSRPAARAGR